MASGNTQSNQVQQIKTKNLLSGTENVDADAASLKVSIIFLIYIIFNTPCLLMFNYCLLMDK